MDVMNVEKFLEEVRDYQVIVDKIAELALDPTESATSFLSGFLLVKDIGPYDKFTTPAIACRGFLSRGASGVQVLSSLIERSDSVILTGTIVDSLWYAAHGELAPIMPIRHGLKLADHLQAKLTPATVAKAGDAFREFVIKAQSDEDAFDLLVHFMNVGKIKSVDGPISSEAMRNEVFKIIRESSIKISIPLLDEFEQLMLRKVNEEQYQRFLTSNPVLLDPLASRVVPKQKFGVEFITDYVIQRMDNLYLAVEIEKPQDLIFTKTDDFSSAFTHAFGQVIDFLEWVDTHSEYARFHMPGISSPRGMLVIGMRADLSPRQTAKLKRLSINMPNIEIMTFDDILERGRTLYRNIHRPN